jgi:hypothetical protein
MLNAISQVLLRVKGMEYGSINLMRWCLGNTRVLREDPNTLTLQIERLRENSSVLKFGAMAMKRL